MFLGRRVSQQPPEFEECRIKDYLAVCVSLTLLTLAQET